VLPIPLTNLTLLEDVFEYQIRKKGGKAGKNKTLQLDSTSTPRVKKLLQHAMEWKVMLESGKATDQAEIAHQQGLSRARVTQIMSLLRLAPEVQEYILAMAETTGRSALSERLLRPITRIDDHRKQLKAFHRLI
jgi:hypothetical protein